MKSLNWFECLFSQSWSNCVPCGFRPNWKLKTALTEKPNSRLQNWYSQTSAFVGCVLASIAISSPTQWGVVVELSSCVSVPQPFGPGSRRQRYAVLSAVKTVAIWCNKVQIAHTCEIWSALSYYLCNMRWQAMLYDAIVSAAAVQIQWTGRSADNHGVV